MNLTQKLKSRFRKKEAMPVQIENPTPTFHSECKYKNMIIIAQPKTFYDDTKDKPYGITALDEDNNPIKKETIKVKIDNEEFEFKTNNNGKIKIPPDFSPKKHEITIKFPNGKYGQIIKTHIIIKEGDKPKNRNKKKKTKKRSEKYTNLFANDMVMFINDEGTYYVRLRDKNYTPIAGEEITITINNESHTVITDKKGFGRVNIENLGSGKYEVLTEYKGSENYDPCKTTSTLRMLIRDIDKEVIMEVKNLTMEFKVTKDKIDTLKEFIIRTLKRNKQTHEKIRVLDDISFKVYKGDKLGILGFNGAGKSTLLKIMSGIYEPTSGTVDIQGNIAPLLELGAGFDKNYTGKNNIFLNGALLSLNEKVIKEKYDDIVEFSELGEFIDFPIKNYSSGMRTKLGFSIATLIDPDILIIDEILSVGDIKFKKKSADKINSMMQNGATVLLVSHSINQIKEICDRCIWLEDGKIKMDGDAEETCDAYVKRAKHDMK